MNPKSTIFAAAAISLAATPAFAHLGHVGELAGHGHWVGMGALGIATGIAAAAAILSDRKKRREAEAEPDTGDEEAEAAETG